MLDEGPALFSRRVVKAQRRCVTAVDKDQTFQAARQGRQRKMLRRDFAAAGDLNSSAFDDAVKSLAGALADMRNWQQGDVFLLCRGHDGGGQRMLRILLEAADELEHF